jgi:hypothetical protein
MQNKDCNLFSDVKTNWQPPVIKYIDIKRTMDGSGVMVDYLNNAAANALTTP